MRESGGGYQNYTCIHCVPVFISYYALHWYFMVVLHLIYFISWPENKLEFLTSSNSEDEIKMYSFDSEQDNKSAYAHPWTSTGWQNEKAENRWTLVEKFFCFVHLCVVEFFRDIFFFFFQECCISQTKALMPEMINFSKTFPINRIINTEWNGPTEKVCCLCKKKWKTTGNKYMFKECDVTLCVKSCR